MTPTMPSTPDEPGVEVCILSNGQPIPVVLATVIVGEIIVWKSRSQYRHDTRNRGQTDSALFPITDENIAVGKSAFRPP